GGPQRRPEEERHGCAAARVIEERPGGAGARRTLGGFGGAYRGPPTQWMRPCRGPPAAGVIEERHGSAAPRRTLGGFGGPYRGPQLSGCGHVGAPRPQAR